MFECVLILQLNNCQVLQALKRLKNTSTDERGKMTEGTKRIFDELTEAAMKLMDNGEYGQSVFFGCYIVQCITDLTVSHCDIVTCFIMASFLVCVLCRCLLR
jgi:hypothetical protein